MAAGKQRVLTVGSWSPGLRSLIGSTTAPCGCVIGVYQTWRGTPLRVVDLCHPRCALGHATSDVLHDEARLAGGSPQG